MRKKLFLILSVLLVIMAACKAPVSREYGKEDVAYLLFVTRGQYKGSQVNVNLDNGTSFKADVVTSKKANRKGISYQVATGRRHIQVSYQGQTLYDRDVLLSTQETKVIDLP